VNEELATLYRVQELDAEIARRQQALAALDRGAELEQQIGPLRTELADLRQRQQAAENENLSLELELRTLQQKRDGFQTQLYSGRVSNPRQLSDLQQEVDMLGREARRVEDRMLELMEVMESQRGQIAAGEARLGDLEQQLDAVRARYEEVAGRLRAEIADLEASRGETAQRVSAPLLRRYEQIRARSANIGVVKVIGRDCPGCHIALPSETLKHLKAGRSGLACENCARLLFWEAPGQGDAP
jgi:predicted  nucleic acid-binding Zn-ribbon protein